VAVGPLVNALIGSSKILCIKLGVKEASWDAFLFLSRETKSFSFSFGFWWNLDIVSL